MGKRRQGRGGEGQRSEERRRKKRGMEGQQKRERGHLAERERNTRQANKKTTK